MSNALRQRLRLARFHWRQGRASGYPACCVTHFCVDSLAGWRAAPVRHNPNERDGEPGVVCGVFHAGPSPLPLRKRLGEIVAWQRIYVLPGSRGRAFRRAVTPQREEPWDDPPSLEPLLDPELDWY